MNVTLTPTMQDFVRRQVEDGLVVSAEEYVRFLIAMDLRHWEKVNRRPWWVNTK